MKKQNRLYQWCEVAMAMFSGACWGAMGVVVAYIVAIVLLVIAAKTGGAATIAVTMAVGIAVGMTITGGAGVLGRAATKTNAAAIVGGEIAAIVGMVVLEFPVGKIEPIASAGETAMLAALFGVVAGVPVGALVGSKEAEDKQQELDHQQLEELRELEELEEQYPQEVEELKELEERYHQVRRKFQQVLEQRKVLRELREKPIGVKNKSFVIWFVVAGLVVAVFLIRLLPVEKQQQQALEPKQEQLEQSSALEQEAALARQEVEAELERWKQEREPILLLALGQTAWRELKLEQDLEQEIDLFEQEGMEQELHLLLLELGQKRWEQMELEGKLLFREFTEQLEIE